MIRQITLVVLVCALALTTANPTDKADEQVAQVSQLPAAPAKLLGIGEEKDCVWHGTSPICDGGCNVVGHFVKKTSKGGEFENDGKACLTGVKVLCCPGVSVSI